MRWLPTICLLLPLAPALAQNPIHRCIGADGNPVFTDRVCSDVQATPTRPAASPAATTAPAIGEPPPILCAADLAELKQGVVDAFATRDANRLAGLMLWGGYGRRAVVADIGSLRELMQRPLLDVAETAPDAAPDDSGFADGPAPPGTAAAPATGATRALVLRTAADDGTGVAREARYAIVRSAGCLWLRPAG
ncbi:hypothetical protein ASG87_09710 [Frateuria sp. Soil773]|uniref:DUF4124 domain-containing protein n=1 Tax=Frateuria sp. Soil773 TaxID=1736407 RepID=UPI0006F2ADF5|nr:DUF4124 domain-containing protein [Frateuria sp. Soil773]KRE88831.1 hypothetical protein ASG87_09710 [Frateuria sp. Soil773]